MIQVCATACAALCCGTLFAGSNTYEGPDKGDWFVDDNWALKRVPTAGDDVSILGKTVYAAGSISACSLHIAAGAALHLGSSSERMNVSATIEHDLVVEDQAKLYAYAGELKGFAGTPESYPDTFANQGTATAAIFANANIITVGGDFIVKEGGTVYPDNAPVTGTPVFFKVEGDFKLTADSSIDTTQRGWGWVNREWETHPAGGKVRLKEGATIYQGWTLAFGSGRSYGCGGGYGGAGLGSPLTFKGVTPSVDYGLVYGTDFAPFLPGSPAGWFMDDINRARGSGSICIFAEGTANIAGTLNANGATSERGGASGGGIWLAAGEILLDENASLLAHGMNTANKNYKPGGGGRIALLDRYSDFSEIELLAESSKLPADYGMTAISGCTVDVAPGASPNQATAATAGTAVRISSAASLTALLTVEFVGEGQVTVGGRTYTETFSVDASFKDGISLAASGTGGSRFLSWEGALVPGGVCETAELTFSPQEDGSIKVNFAEGTVRRAWVGAAGGELLDPANWSPAGTPAAADELYLTNAVLSVSGALSAAKLTIAGASAIAFNAVPIEGESTAENICGNPTVIAVAGEMLVDDTSVITVANDPVTGAAVRFDVGSFSLAEGARVTADGKGWFWYKSSGDPLATYTQGAYQCRAMGAGGDNSAVNAYNRGAGHGAKGGNPLAPYGNEYGLKYAPFLPGSPNGLHAGDISRGNPGGGTVWIRCASSCEIRGAVTADGLTTSFGTPSGGGIWISARGFMAGPNAVLSANGGDFAQGVPSSYAGYGAGGRISLSIGLTDGQLAALARGEQPEDLAYSDSIDLISTSVRGGRKISSVISYGNPGTVTTVIGPLACIIVKVEGSPVSVRGCDPECGSVACEPGVLKTFTAPAYGVDVFGEGYLYACAGYVVSNATGEVASGPGRSVEVTTEAGLRVIWLWKDPQMRTRFRKSAHGALRTGGEIQDGDVVAWTTGEVPAVEAVADEGYEFVCWQGNVPLGTATDNPLEATITEPLDVTPVFRVAEAAATRTWKGTGVWTDATKWTPKGNIPGAGDTVVIASGTCEVSNVLAVAALEVTGGTLAVGRVGRVNGEVRVAGDAMIAGGAVQLGVERTMHGHAKLSAGGDLTLGDGATVTVYGGPLGGDYTFASGSSFIDVKGTFALTGTAVLKPVSDMLTGGSVKITAGAFTVAETAKVDAEQAGFMWVDSQTPPLSPGTGESNSLGASHGGIGRGSLAGGKTTPRYDYELAPQMPGSPNGLYQNNIDNGRRGGGVIRVHAETISVAGTLTANSAEMNGYGGASGGSIWLTADSFAFAPTAVLSAQGCGSGQHTGTYGSMGTGGRIAIEYGLTAEQIESLAATGAAKMGRVRGIAAFEKAFPGVDVTDSVRGGKEYSKDGVYAESGTFVFLPKAQGLVLFVR